MGGNGVYVSNTQCADAMHGNDEYHYVGVVGLHLEDEGDDDGYVLNTVIFYMAEIVVARDSREM